MSESMLIMLAYAGFPVVAIAFFALMEARLAAISLYLGGWLLLPVADYPTDTLTSVYFTVEVIGVALPSNLGATKGALIPLAILVAWLIVRVRRIAWAELAPLDLAMACFCLWPIAGALLHDGDVARAWRDALYLSAAWGATWVLGRALLPHPDDWVLLLRGVAWSGVALLPAALIEGWSGPWLYRAIWGDHAFLLEGAERFVGYRPLAFLEHGNQYALWMAASAFAWLALARLGAMPPRHWPWALATVIATVAAQSVGAIVLLTVGALAAVIPLARLRRALTLGGATVALLGAIYISGIVPAERIARSTGIGQQMVAGFGATRLHSLLYRIRRDQMAIPLLRQAPLTGTGRWDWWRPLGSHPWGLPLLLLGQFGAVSLLLLVVAMLVSPVATLFRDDKRGVLCAILVLIAAADAIFNSYIYFPALLFTAALVGRSRARSDASRPVGART